MSRHRRHPARAPKQAGPRPGPSPVPAAETTTDLFTPTECLPRQAAAPDREPMGVARPDRTRPDRTGPRHRRTPPRGGGRRTGLVLLAATAGVVGLPSAGAASADPQCRWQRAAHELAVALSGQPGATATHLRNALTRAGVGTRLPAECAPPVTGRDLVPAPTPGTHGTATPSTGTPSTGAPTTAPAESRVQPPRTATTTRPSAPATTAPVPPPAPAGTGTGTTAAERFGWGTPTKTENFDGDLSGWGVYDGPGHAGNGRRTPDAATVQDGILTITGDAKGNTAGMAWGDGQKYGRWEGRVKAPVSDESYNALLLLWPDAENFPVGGEIDFMEMTDHTRQTTELFLHYGASNSQVAGKVAIDATQWHNWAVEWTPTHVAAFVDGKEWFRTTDTSILPPGPMHMTIQLDWFPTGGAVTPSQMQVDWVKQYAL